MRAGSDPLLRPKNRARQRGEGRNLKAPTIDGERRCRRAPKELAHFIQDGRLLRLATMA
jgi:hypothetical protein